MSHNPKLNVYTLRIKPKENVSKTFRDLIKLKFSISSSEDNEIFRQYFEIIKNEIGNDTFREDKNNKKVLGVTDSYVPIRPHNNTYIDGVIEGGKYGIKREYANTENKQDKRIITEKDAVLDKYYFLLYTPLNATLGFLLIQSYTEETIQDSLKVFIKNFFQDPNYFKISIEPYVPENIIEKYIETSHIKMFRFTRRIQLSESLRNNVQIESNEFEVEINIKPLNTNLKPGTEYTDKILKELEKKEFDNIQLREGKGKAYIEDRKGKKANFNIEQEFKRIKPTIYLEEEGITTDSSGLPDFRQVREYCTNLLSELIEEFKNTDIHEF